MPPKRRSQTNPPPLLTQEAVNQLVRDGIEAAIRAERERVREEATRAGGLAGGPAAAPVARECTFTGFMKCGPTQFHGTEGAVGICHWFEKMESTFGISECAERRKVKFATATLHGRALTWWNSQVATIGLEVANGKPWTEVKRMMTDEFYPTEEVRRLEDELRHLKLRDMNIAAYTDRFNELALLCPDVVPNEKKKVELYIKELPEIIKGETTSSRPATLNEAVRMAHTLMEQKIQDKAERIAESNKRKWESNNNNYHNNNRGNYRDNDRHNQYNDRRQGGARAMTTEQNDDVDQGGPAPNCNRCGLCHFGQCPSKCNRCGRRGHKANDCRKRTDHRLICSVDGQHVRSKGRSFRLVLLQCPVVDTEDSGSAREGFVQTTFGNEIRYWLKLTWVAGSKGMGVCGDSDDVCKGLVGGVCGSCCEDYD
ncbi:putative reverse transcriptase domain-containing protein [Tanacetum coccineum]|uniref:Reverse transcriptase domain-containing protein n=1 Tax=Tanacetum coccineum TaxID=301880 RepID=A0ABQ5IKP9_9ASTR